MFLQSEIIIGIIQFALILCA